jgi:hypothetical protein
MEERRHVWKTAATLWLNCTELSRGNFGECARAWEVLPAASKVDAYIQTAQAVDGKTMHRAKDITKLALGMVYLKL